MCAPGEYAFVPMTFCLPGDRAKLRREVRARAPGTVYIIKPVAMSRGRGVRLSRDPLQLKSDAKALVQEYVARPLLLQKRKFDVRLYVLLTSVDPLRAYVFDQGLVRFAAKK